MLSTFCWIPSTTALHPKPQKSQDLNDNVEAELSDSGSDEELQLSSVDSVFCVGVVETVPRIEVSTYDAAADQIYLWSDMDLQSAPLCSEFILSGDELPLLAVGEIETGIELWNLNNQYARDPHSVLKDSSDPSAVSALASMESSVLLSGSSNGLIHIWDLAKLDTSWHFLLTNTRIASIAQISSQTFACGFGLVATVHDLRQTNGASQCGIEVSSEVERVVPYGEHNLMISTESGTVTSFDVRSLQRPLWTLGDVHGAEAIVDISRHAPLMAAGGKDERISLWDLSRASPTPLSVNTPGQGHVFDLRFHPNTPHLLGAAGSAGKPLVYSVTEDAHL